MIPLVSIQILFLQFILWILHHQKLSIGFVELHSILKESKSEKFYPNHPPSPKQLRAWLRRSLLTTNIPLDFLRENVHLSVRFQTTSSSFLRVWRLICQPEKLLRVQSSYFEVTNSRSFNVFCKKKHFLWFCRLIPVIPWNLPTMNMPSAC